MTNLINLSDSYKFSHFLQDPKGTEIIHSYLAPRGGEYEKVVMHGLPYILKRYLASQITSEDVKQAHASAIESYIEKFVGLDLEGKYRDADLMGTMAFTRTLEDWAKFDINDRTKFDACISSGLAIMANQKHLYVPEKKESKLIINFAKYKNEGTISQLDK